MTSQGIARRRSCNIVDEVKEVMYMAKQIEFEDICKPRKFIPKNNELAQEYRRQGNDKWRCKDYFQALELYNKSICFAENDSEHLGIGYANRAAVYFEYKLFGVSLANVNLAKRSNYPERLKAKLDKRVTDCLAGLKSLDKDCVRSGETDQSFKPELSFAAHPKIPWMAKCLEFRSNNKFGEHLATKRDLAVGQTLIIENAFTTSLPEVFKYQKCTNCLRESDLSLIPCRNCTSAMFCNEQCCAEAMANFHSIECPLIDHLPEDELDILHAVRLTIKAIKTFDSVDELIEFMENFDQQRTNVYAMDYKNADKVRQYYPVYALNTNEDQVTDMEMFSVAVSTSNIYRSLLEMTELQKLFDTERKADNLIKLIFRCILACRTNNYAIETRTDQDVYYDFKMKPQCTGLYPMCSRLNHSCGPNVCRVSYGTKLVILTLRPIKKGEQLFHDYG